MTSKKMFKIVCGPGDFDLILAYLKGPTNQGYGFKATFTIAQADGSEKGHTPFEVHGLDRVSAEVDGHFIRIESNYGTGPGRACRFCGCDELSGDHRCRLEGFYDTRSRSGILWLSDFELDHYFMVDRRSGGIVRFDESGYYDAFTGKQVDNPRAA